MQIVSLVWKGAQIFSTRLNEFGLGVTWLWLWEKVIRMWQGVSPLETTRVIEGLFVGGQHYPRGMALMKQMGIGATLNLREESDDVKRGVAFPLHLSLPAPDDGAPDMNQLRQGVAFIHQTIQSGQGVYIHCAQGVGRAPMMAAAYLISEGHSIDSALKLIRVVRPFITPTPTQMKCLQEWVKQMNNETMRQSISTRSV
jgi:protein-tyrosine phosphatase